MTGPLRVAALVKQVPLVEALRLGPDGRLIRSGLPSELNAYCRRAVSKGVELARETAGSCTVITLGPPPAQDVLREAVAWGADRGVHLCDPAFAGSDTLATARALAAALGVAGPFDLVLLGRNSVDGETGQVGPEVAQLLDLPFAGGVRALELAGSVLRLELELDDGSADVDVDLPAVLSVAERLCEPCKVDPTGRAAVAAERISTLAASDLGPGPWGDAGSPTVVGATRVLEQERRPQVLHGPLAAQVGEAVRLLSERGALGPPQGGAPPPARAVGPPAGRERPRPGGPALVVVAEHGRPGAARELLGAAAACGRPLGAVLHVLCPAGSAPPSGADVVIELEGSRVAEDVADALVAYVDEVRPWAVLAPSTAFGREVAARAAAATGSGLVGDAVSLDVRDGVLVAAKPAFAGALVADVTCRGGVQMATVRPGMLAAPSSAQVTALDGPATDGAPARVEMRRTGTRGRIRPLDERRNDDLQALARAPVVIGVGTGVLPHEYEQLGSLAAVLGAELAATRKVTDKGWAPRARQVGITGRSVAPRLYVAIGLSGKFNHMVGVRAAGTILAVNGDAEAPVFAHCDVGIVGDWHEVVPLLASALDQLGRRDEAATVP